MIRRPPRSTPLYSSAASDVYKRQYQRRVHGDIISMQITIKTVTGRKIDLNVDDDTTVLQIKQTLQEREGIDAAMLKLIYNGKPIPDDNLKMKDLNIKPGAAMHVVLNLKGGQ
eukprot:TRINITY_DN12713_c0_g2_i18.p1 TRINITY_DN12713_c0_g2~~TRINITY_DN12713_c0_g2_i18.p1  ORF type:complete len:120 (-),score=45.12 TRINITY_DN12713_c0_g2_i18:3-341(-)